MGCAFSGLFPLLLLSKLVSKLDVLPGQFEVAFLPPPPTPQAARCQCWPGGLGIRGRRMTDPASRTGRLKKDPTTTTTLLNSGLGS